MADIIYGKSDVIVIQRNATTDLTDGDCAVSYGTVNAELSKHVERRIRGEGTAPLTSDQKAILPAYLGHGLF